MFVVNEYFDTVDFDACVAIMDNDLREEAHKETIFFYDTNKAGIPEQFFFDVYCNLHRKKYGEEFEPNKRNGVW